MGHPGKSLVVWKGSATRLPLADPTDPCAVAFKLTPSAVEAVKPAFTSASAGPAFPEP
jgi:hypothetical protein